MALHGADFPIPPHRASRRPRSAETERSALRRFGCARCGKTALICSRCDRGQIYCSAGCAKQARRDSQRRAGAAHQASGPLLPPFANFYRELNRACDQIGVPRFSLNDCRRTFGSWMVQEGVPVFTVSKLMGHSSPAMVQQVYGRLSDESMRAAVSKMPTSRKRKRAPTKNGNHSRKRRPRP